MTTTTVTPEQAAAAVANLTPGGRCEVSRNARGPLFAERSTDGRQLRFVRETTKGSHTVMAWTDKVEWVRPAARGRELLPSEMSMGALVDLRDEITSRIATYRQPGVPVRLEDRVALEAVTEEIEERREKRPESRPEDYKRPSKWSVDFVGCGAASGPCRYRDLCDLPFEVDATHVVAEHEDGGLGKLLEVYDGRERLFIRVSHTDEG